MHTSFCEEVGQKVMT